MGGGHVGRLEDPVDDRASTEASVNSASSRSADGPTSSGELEIHLPSVKPETEMPSSKRVWSRNRRVLLPLLAPTLTRWPPGRRQSKLRSRTSPPTDSMTRSTPRPSVTCRTTSTKSSVV